MTPNQLFTAGVLQLWKLKITAFDFFNSVDDNYGIDTDDSVANDHDDEGDAEGAPIPHSTVQLSEEQLRELQSSVNLQTDDGNHGMSHYQQIVQYISQQLETA